MLADQLGELKLAELLDTPPPGLDEAIAISKVMEFVDSPDYNMFTRIVFDTTPTVILLHLSDEKKYIASATSAIKSVFGKEQPPLVEGSTDKLEQLRERMGKVRDLFRDSQTTEFVIVTIPTIEYIFKWILPWDCTKGPAEKTTNNGSGIPNHGFVNGFRIKYWLSISFIIFKKPKALVKFANKFMLSFNGLAAAYKLKTESEADVSSLLDDLGIRLC
ncbi:hypothetical protein L2E82_05240 [Cichorium intybus]|uniref:Uncharacterized protein n=1 Tax=Cichorium intybus TaxID=13427 RepID=A0ACB9H815_CICIN|nr:hypothetical protein L2E82_05240 [Cichorium intybus]